MKYVILLCIILSSVYADYLTKYVWYNEEPELSRIVITLEELRGRKNVDNFDLNKLKFQKKNKFLTRDYDNRNNQIFTKNTVIDGHTIKTIIDITPPKLHGIDGSLAHTVITIIFDGIQRAKLPLGSYYGSNSIEKIIIHTQEMSIHTIYFNEMGYEAIYFKDNDKLHDECLIFKNDKPYSIQRVK